MPMDISNVLVFNPKSKKGERVGFRVEDGKKVRVLQERRRSRHLRDRDGRLHEKYQSELAGEIQKKLGLEESDGSTEASPRSR